MTDKEAIKIIKDRNFYCIECIDRSEKCCKALKMAIESLENQKSVIEELENIKTELNNKSFSYSLTENFENDIVIGVITVSDMEKILDNHISELKGE